MESIQKNYMRIIWMVFLIDKIGDTVTEEIKKLSKSRILRKNKECK